MVTQTGVQCSALETFLREQTPQDPKYPDYLHHLTLQILHNLQHQHRWTDLQVRDKAPLSGKLLPRPLIQGLPPKRLYVHPDEQTEILKNASQRSEQQNSLNSEDDHDVSALEKPEIEWVLPSHVREKWSVGQFAAVFDAMDDEIADKWKTWEAHKRVVLAILQDDSTIVYYVLNDGIVKPRQN